MIQSEPKVATWLTVDKSHYDLRFLCAHVLAVTTPTHPAAQLKSSSLRSAIVATLKGKCKASLGDMADHCCNIVVALADQRSKREIA
jgi:hypothetical protein